MADTHVTSSRGDPDDAHAPMSPAGKRAWIFHAVLCAGAAAWMIYVGSTFVVPRDSGGLAGMSAGYRPDWLMIAYCSAALMALAATPAYPPIAVLSYLVLAYGISRGQDQGTYLEHVRFFMVLALVGILGVGLSWLARRDRPRWRGDPISLLMLAMAAWIGVCALAAEAAGGGLHPLADHDPIKYFQLLLLFLMAAATLGRRREALILAVLIPLIVTANVHWSAASTWHDNESAALLAMVIPLALIACYDRRGSMVLKIIGVVLAANLLRQLVGMQNRGAGLAIVALAPVLWLMSRRKWLWLAVGIPAAAAGAAAFVHSGYYERFKSAWNHGYDSGLERFPVWKAGWAMFRDHPIFGVGPGNFPSLLQTYAGRGSGLANMDAQNSFLNMLSETGLAGLALYTALLAAALMVLARIAWRGKRSHPAPAAMMVLCSLVAYVVVGLFISRTDMTLAYVLLGWAVALDRAGAAEAHPPDVHAGTTDDSLN